MKMLIRSGDDYFHSCGRPSHGCMLNHDILTTRDHRDSNDMHPQNLDGHPSHSNETYDSPSTGKAVQEHHKITEWTDKKTE